MSTQSNLWNQLASDKTYREEFVISQVKQGIPFQIHAMRTELGLSQKELANRSNLTQGVVSRAEDPDYGNLTLNTLIRVAAGFDVAFIGNFVPFSDLVNWFDNLSEESVQVETFEKEYRKLQRPRLVRRKHSRKRSGKRFIGAAAAELGGNNLQMRLNLENAASPGGSKIVIFRLTPPPASFNPSADIAAGKGGDYGNQAAIAAKK